MKKVLMVTSVASMIKQFNISNINILQELGYEVAVATNFENPGTIPIKDSLELKESLEDNDIIVYNIKFNRSPFAKSNKVAYGQLKKIINDERYTLIHCQSPMGGALARLAAKEVQNKGTKVIYTAHGFHFFEGAPLKNWIIYYPIEKTLSYFTDTIITINEEDFKFANRFNAKQVKYVPGIGIDLKRFTPQTEENKMFLREEYEISKKDFILLYVAELSDRKNQMMLLRVMKKIKDIEPNIKLLLAGQGKNKEIYEKYIDKHNLENTSILGFRNDIDKLMQISDVKVSSSLQEGLPVNLMEAMATGLPIVATNCRGNRDLVINNENGFLVDIDDEQTFVDKILMMHRDSVLRTSLGKNSLKNSEKYSINNVNKIMEEIYKF